MTRIKKLPDHETFHFFNLNPFGKRAGDCVIRAVSAFLQLGWETTYRELADNGIKNGYIVNDDENYQMYLAQKGYEKHKQPRKPNGNKYTAQEFCKEIAKPGHEYVLRLANHLTYVGPDRRIWDTWDCCYKTVGNYWEKQF